MNVCLLSVRVQGGQTPVCMCRPELRVCYSYSSFMEERIPGGLRHQRTQAERKQKIVRGKKKEGNEEHPHRDSILPCQRK